MAVDGTLSRKQIRAIAALLTASTTQEAAKQANVGLRTLHRWMGGEDFREALRDAESAALDTATRRLVSLSGKAVATLESVLDDAKASPSAKTRAATVVITSLLKLRELRDLEARLATLEENAHVNTNTY